MSRFHFNIKYVAVAGCWLRELPNHVPTTCALLLETKDSFVSLVKKIVFVTMQ